MLEMFSRKITKDESRDTGMAMVLLSLILFVVFKRNERFILVAIVLHILNMVVPLVFRPVAVIWLGVSHLLGTLMSKVLLSIVFLLVVVPVASVRRWLGKDSLKLRAFKAGQHSVMVERNHTFTKGDLEKPY